MEFLNLYTLVICSFAALAALFFGLATIGTYRLRVKDYRKFKYPFAGATILGLVLALVGILDVPSTAYMGYRISPDFRVLELDPRGPAATAGVMKEDIILEIAGVSTNQPQLYQQLEPAVGQQVAVKVFRGGGEHRLTLGTTALPGNQLALIWVGNLLALLTLAIGLFIFWRRPSKSTTFFFLCTLFFALYMMSTPRLENSFLGNVVLLNVVLFLSFGLTFFLHLALIFPRPKPLIAEGGFWELIIYVPAPLIVINYLGLLLFQPRADLLTNVVLHIGLGMLVLAVLILAVAAVAHSFWISTSTERSRGMSWVLWGSFLGVVPVFVTYYATIFFPQVVLPGGQYYFLLTFLVPASFAWALWRWPEVSWKRPVGQPKAA